ncbi:MAG: AMP-binding protein [Oscillospiraceae bacterium]|nr:AMP-binding protein [Oscillospiraceae bacterium]
MEYVSDYSKLLELGNLHEYLKYISVKHPRSYVYQELKGESVISHTYKDLANDARRAGNYLLKNGYSNRHISLIGNFNYEWLTYFFALLYSGNVVVPIDYGQSRERILDLAMRADANVIIARKKILSGDREIVVDENIRNIIYFEDLDSIIKNDAFEVADGAYAPPTQDTTAMIMYTSGTTGISKGILLTHKNILHNAIATASRIGEHAFEPGRTSLALLPPFHMFWIAAGIFATFYYGDTLCGSENTLKDIERLIKTFRPTCLISVPQIADGIHKKIWAMAKSTGKEKTLRTALKVSNTLRKIKIDLRPTLFKSITESFGGNLHTMICGGAAVDEQVIKEMSDFGITILVGYGVNECSSIVSVNPPERQKNGSIGLPIPAPFCRVKIKDDEIMISGSIVMSGYYNDPEGTEEAFDGEWFKTGDIGHIDEDGYLYITGRKKNLIILSDGNNISPEELEAQIRESPIVDSVLVHVKESSRAKVLHASVYPNAQYCEANAITDVKGELMRLISQMNAENPRYMEIFDVDVRDAPFEKTAIGKIKRYLYTNESINT